MCKRASEDLSQLTEHPLFEYASTIAFPNSFAGIREVIDGMKRLEERLVAVLNEEKRVLEKAPMIASGPEGLRSMRVVLPLGFSLLETAWEAPSLIPTITENQIMLRNTAVYNGPVPSGFGEYLDEELSRLRKAGRPVAVDEGRAKLVQMLHGFWKRLWWAHTLGIDYDRGAA